MGTRVGESDICPSLWMFRKLKLKKEEKKYTKY
jgi:hypothetical protein